MAEHRLLVVEDSPTQAEALRALLAVEGYRVEVAHSGEEALARAVAEPFHLVLSDVVMPGMGGYEMCREIRRRLGPAESPPIVLLTSMSDARDIVRGLESGADHYVTKPYDPEQLVARIRQVLASARSRPRPAPEPPIAVELHGERFTITADRQQILDLMLASFDELVRANRALQVSKRALTEANSRERHAREEAERAAAHAEAASRARDDVLATVSHDLRNPLGTIYMSASVLLEMELSPERQRQQLDVIRRTADRMTRLLQDLLDVSRIEAGRFDVLPEPTTVRGLMAEAAELLTPIATARGVLLAEWMENPDQPVLADRERALQVFSNLVGNAVKFSPQGSTVTTTTRRQAGVVVFSVHDEGPGVAPDHLPHIFDRYWQAGTRATSGGGAGLGLSIVKGIVEAHGGRVWVESTPGEGATFYFTLPVSDATASG